MRFRLGLNTNGGGQTLTGGVGNAMQNIFQLPLLQAQAAEEYQNGEMKRGLMGAQQQHALAGQREADAHAALLGQQAEAGRQQLARGGLGEMVRTAALQNGVPLNQLDDAASYLQSGKLPEGVAPGPGGMGPTLPVPSYADPSLGAKIYQQLGLTRQALTMGDKDVAHIADAAGKYQRQDGVRQVQADPSSAGRVGQSFAAADGKKLIDNIGNTGRGYNMFTGDGDTLAPGVAALYDQGERAQIGQRNAAAGASNASAAHSLASAAQVRQNMDQNGRTGDLQVVTGPDGAVTVVNKRTLTAQPVLGADGRPIIKGAAGGGGKPMTDSQAKANLFGGRMLESDKILGDMESQGVVRPGTIKSVATGVAGALPIVGDALAEGAAAGTNWTQSSEQQRVEQAQRDFINAVLRRESGAAIAPSEFSNAQKQYFPQPGDGPAVRAQKARNRQIATTLMLQEVPEAQRYRPGMAPAGGPSTVAAGGGGGASGSWGAPAAPAGWAIQRVN